MTPGSGITRRELVKRAGIGASGFVLSGVAAQPIWARARSIDASNTIKIGFVSPLTGPAAGFGEGDPYILGLARKALAKGMTIGGTHYTFEIVGKDSQSSPARCAQVANELIHSDSVDILLATSTPESSTRRRTPPRPPACPASRPSSRGRRGTSAAAPSPGQASPFSYTYHFCFGDGRVRLRLHPPRGRR